MGKRISLCKLKSKYTLFSEGLEFVKIEDCTNVGDLGKYGIGKKIKCGQRNVKRLKEKMNELAEWVINPEYSKQLYLYTHSYLVLIIKKTNLTDL